jgi:hypothetical protein
MVRESHPRARSRVFRAIATLNRAASKFAQLPRLRVHILSVSNQADGMRSLRAAIATDTGGEAAGLLFTGIVVSENSRMAAGYTVTKPAPPESIAAGLFLPEGSGAGPVIAAVSALKRVCDRLSVVRYTPGGSLAGVHQLLGSLEPGGGVRHVFLHADQLSESDPATACQAVVAQARACAARIHSISLRGSAIRYGRMLAGQTGGSATVVETMDEAAAACAKLYLGLLHLYEIAYRTPDRTAAPAEVKLEAYAESGYGAGVLRAAIPSGMA